ncbi:hypothetical protein [Faecalibacter macacae]|uniref:Cytoplasmic protein n=1 Tax=Faecalibacter macacae TaxID=1859289 RepID=A0A3L9M2X2_9FLAO|nr:hypothetical protein [Faecalibacter macacae]RLZ06376.1 hypothetical protein EAH69_13770 [Faecalibacter macacae]
MTNIPSKYNREFLLKSHDKSSSHKSEILNGKLCGCFYCEQTFSPQEILEWIEEPNGGETAICPKCGIDSVLSSEFPISDKEFLDEMNKYWF